MAAEKPAAPVNRVQVVVRVRPTLEGDANEDPAVTCAADGSNVQVCFHLRYQITVAICIPVRFPI